VIAVPVSVLAVDNARGVWGAQLVLQRLAERLIDRDVEITLYTPEDSEFASSWQDAGLALLVDRSPVGASPRIAGALSASAMARMTADGLTMSVRVARAARAGGFDLLHGNGHGTHLQTAIAARLAGRPALLHLHEELPHRLGARLRALSLRTANHAIAVSPSIRAALDGDLRQRVCVLRNGVDLKRFMAGPRSAHAETTIVAITRIDPVKRIEDLLDALLPLRDDSTWHALVVGDATVDTAYAEGLQRRAAAEFGQRVRFTGRVDDVAGVLSSADLLVHTGTVEGMPLNVLEAQACGVPVVAYAVAGIPDVVSAGNTGLLAAPGNCAELSVHIQTLVCDPVRRSEMAQAAAKNAVAFDIERQADEYAALVRSIVRGEPTSCLSNADTRSPRPSAKDVADDMQEGADYPNAADDMCYTVASSQDETNA
jgi:glycosyltransferase involved in cell wall biosynthesis